MTVLLAREFAAGRFSKVLTFKARQDGGGALATKWNGSVESMVVRNAARFFAREPKAVDMEVEINPNCKFRVSRVS